MSNDVQDGTSSTELTVESAAELLGLLSVDSEKEKAPAATPETTDQDSDGSDEDVEETAEQAPDEDNDDTPTDEESDDEDAVKPKTRRIKVDGEEVEVTDEELEKGYSRTADYTRKTQALAEQRKAAEADFSAVKAERAQYADYLTQLRTALEDTTPRAPDWDALRSQMGPGEFAAAYVEWDQRSKEIESVRRAESVAHERKTEDQRALMQSYVDAESVKMFDAIPEWSNPKTAKKEMGEIRDFAHRRGFTDEDLRTVTDHRLVLTLRDAMRHEQSRDKTPEIKNRVREVTAATPGTTSAPKRSTVDKANARLRESGSVEDAAARIALML